jgi:4-amino-4-deoxy-L-arabinose transferase-like glycosyltransferase
LIAGFVIALFPYAMSGVLTNPDEPHYINAGLIMCRTHDWLMPACPNDAGLTELKPILTYWILAASYRVFGPSMAAAHLPYLLAGAAVIWWTHRLTILLCSLSTPQASRSASTLVCALLLCDPCFWLCSIRCTPDIWLCLFLLMSTYGFLGLLVLESPTRRHALLAYLGLALAILTKGIPALILFGCVLSFACCNPWRSRSWRRLIHVPSMALGTVLALSWFVVVLLTHGNHSLDPLWSDSITTRIDRHPLRMLSHLIVVLIVLLATIAPVAWPASKLGFGWRKILPPNPAERSAWSVMALWTIVTGLSTAAAFPLYLRYLLPAIPMLSAMSAIALIRIDPAILAHCFRRCLAIGLMFATAVMVLVAVLCVQMHFGAWYTAIFFMVISAIAAVGIVGMRG